MNQRYISEMRLSFILILNAALLCLPLLAGTTGKIAGQVLDQQTGEPLVAVNVYLEGGPLGASTDTDGFYFILNVPPGTHTLIAQFIGYQETHITNVKVDIDLTTRINLSLSPGEIAGEEVVVMAQRPLIQKDLTSSSVRVTKEEINALPVDNFNEIVALQAGVVAGHFRGGRDGEVAYMVDGIPVNDPYNNSIGIGVENSFIQQLEVISGTFNAEYGQAMSGIVNIVTREGSSEYEAEVSAYASNYYSQNTDIFPHINTLDGQGSQNLQASLGGSLPFLDKVRFFMTGRAVQDDGYLFGTRFYNISDNNPFTPSGDSASVPMNNSDHKSFGGKLTYYLTPSFKVNYGFLWDDNFNHYYDHAYQFAPDGILNNFRTNSNHYLMINHGISSSTFYTLRFSTANSHYTGYLFEDPFDERYVIPEQGQPQSNYTFRSGGNQNWRYDRTTTTWQAKLDFSSQISREHKLGGGLLYRYHELANFGTAFRSEVVGFDPVLLQDISQIAYPEPRTPGYDQFNREPIEVSAYLQDKMEYDDLIINAGLRFDYFDPRTSTLSDVRNPDFNPFFPSGNLEVDPKLQLSPRLGVAFPISSSGVIHVAYGHFFQIPNFEQIYQGITDFPDESVRYLIDQNGLQTLIGNPDLDAQRTVSYEIGLQQGLTGQLAVEFTGFFRDIRNLVGTQIVDTYDQNIFGRYINTDYANVRGVILSFEKRFANHWGARLDYTYQVAEGNASDPRAAFFDSQSGNEPEKQFIPLDWDQRSTLNFSFNFGNPGNWNVGLVSKYGSGTPYTADIRFTGVNVNFRNNRIKPSSLLFDLKADKTFTIAGTRINSYLWVQNLLDRLNEWGVYSSTGRANNDLNTRFAGDVFGINTIEQYINNPSFYSPPRLIRFGLAFGL